MASLARSGVEAVSPGWLRAVGLPAAMTTVMIGIVFAVNPGIWGIGGLVAGVLATIIGVASVARIYRATGPRRRGESADSTGRPHGDEEP